MKLLLAFFFFLSTPAHSAEHKDFWYKVEPTDDSAKENPSENRPPSEGEKQKTYDLEWDAKASNVDPLKYWSRDSYLGLGIGYNNDKPYRNKDHRAPWVLQIQGQFSDKGWRRMNVKGFLDQKNGLYVTTNFQWTESRKSFRTFYGVGVGMRLRAKDQLKNFIIFSNYRITVGGGGEWLMTKKTGLRLEGDLFASSENLGLIISLNYLIRI